MINAKNAYSIIADLGLKENRLNLTLGHAFSLNNRFKITVEVLAQQQTFDFNSGSIDEWVSQYAGGVAFQHIVGIGFLHDIEIGAYYAQALNRTLDSVFYYKDDEPFLNYRHIAGAASRGVNAAIGIHPWKTGTILFTGYYDFIHYRNHYNDVSADDSQALGYGITLTQYISSSLQATARYIKRSVYISLEAGINFCHNIFHDTRAMSLSISVQRSSTDNVPDDNRATIELNYYFAPINNRYHTPSFQLQSVPLWVGHPVVKMAHVLVAADQMIKKANVTATISDNAVLSFKALTQNGRFAEQISWHGVTTNVPGSHLIYYLTLKKSPTLASTQPLLNNASILGNSYIAENLDSDTTYTVRLIAVDETTGVSHQYTGTFSTGEAQDIITWPTDLKPRLIDLTKQDNGIFHARLTFNLAESSLDSTLSYKVSIKDNDTNKIIFKRDHYSSTDVEEGIAIDGDVYSGKTYTVIVIPSNAFGTMGKSATGTVNITAGSMSWSQTGPHFEKDVSDATQGTLQWSEAMPSVASDTIHYAVSTGDASTPLLGKYTCNDNTRLCFVSISNLVPNITYRATILASDTYDQDQTQTIAFSTSQRKGTITWNNFSASIASNQIVRWHAATSSKTGALVNYTLTITYTDDRGEQTLVDHQKIQSANDQLSYQLNSTYFLPGVSYHLSFTAQDALDSNTLQKDINEKIDYPLIWTWNHTATVNVKAVGMAEKDYTIMINPDVTLAPALGTVKYNYKIYKSKNADTNITNADTLVTEGEYTGMPMTKKYKVIRNLPFTYYKVRITAYVNHFKNDADSDLTQTTDISERS
jgi:hypothetical protein